MAGTHNDFERGLKARMVAMANANRARINGDFAQVRAIVDSAPLVYGVWPDPAEPDGIGMLILKGQAFLRGLIAGGQGRPVKMTAIPCTCAEQAHAVRHVIGETDNLH